MQALIEKQFPASDRKKVADLFGIDSDASEKLSDRASPAPGELTRRKRKKQGQKYLPSTSSLSLLTVSSPKLMEFPLLQTE